MATLGDAAMNGKKNRDRIWLDIIRGISTVIIVCFHYSCGLIEINFNGYTNYFYHYATNYWGTLGVNLFFLLSGAGLWLGYSENCEPVSYYKRRWLKLFPMFYLCVVPLYFMNALFVKKDFLYGGNPVKMLLTLAGMDGYLRSMMNNYYLTGEWFLGVIIVLYLLFPVLRRILLSDKAAPLFTAVLLVLCFMDARWDFSLIAGRGWLGYFLFVFWLGMLVMKYEEALMRYVKWYYCLPPLAFLLTVRLPVPWKYDLLSVVPALCVVLLLMGLCSIIKLPSAVVKVCRVAARYSYAIFLVHHVIIDLFFKACSGIVNNQNACFFLILLCLLIFLCAFLLFHLERAVMKHVRVPSFLKCRQR